MSLSCFTLRASAVSTAGLALAVVGLAASAGPAFAGVPAPEATAPDAGARAPIVRSTVHFQPTDPKAQAPKSTPGQGQPRTQTDPSREQADGCDHGNTGKPCKADPQPDRGKDCVLHGNSGGINEDHCAPAGTPTPGNTPKPGDTPKPSDTPKPADPPKPGDTPKPGHPKPEHPKPEHPKPTTPCPGDDESAPDDTDTSPEDDATTPVPPAPTPPAPAVADPVAPVKPAPVVQVQAAAATQQAPNQLPYTGTDALPTVLLGSALLAGGATLVLVARRREHH